MELEKKKSKKEKDAAFKSITPAHLKRLAGGRSFDRGKHYYEDDRVVSLAIGGATASAAVEGTRIYKVRLWLDEEGVDGECTCPAYAESGFCKHCVAVGLAVIDSLKDYGPEDASRKTSRGKSKAKTVIVDDLRVFLNETDKKDLVEIIIEQAMNDARFRDGLIIKKMKRGLTGKADLGEFKLMINHAVRKGCLVDNDSAYDYYRNIDQAVDCIRQLLRDNHPAEAVELSEYALVSLEEQLNYVDDSHGYFGDMLDRIQELHLKACKKAKPDPERLARRLFEWEMRAEFDVFYNALEIYADVLGKKGVKKYRELAEEKWSKVKELKPGELDRTRSWEDYRIIRIMELLAEKYGDIEDKVEVKKRDLSHAYDYLQIAALYKEHRLYDKALEWADLGVKAFPENTDTRLLEFLADEYHRRGKHDDAMRYAWRVFSENMNIDNYQRLKHHADKAGQWLLWRDNALNLVRKEIEKRKAREPRLYWTYKDNSLLVEIFLWEKDIQAALNEAKSGGCSVALWLKLAGMLEKDHPDDAIAIYQENLDSIINGKTNNHYREAVNLIKRIKTLMIRVGCKHEFPTYLEQVRKSHKPKRNFMKMLAGVK